MNNSEGGGGSLSEGLLADAPKSDGSDAAKYVRAVVLAVGETVISPTTPLHHY